MDRYFLKDVEDALSDSFQFGFEFASDRIKNASFRFVESLWDNVALKGAFDDILGRKIEKQVQCSIFWTFPHAEHKPLDFLYTQLQS